LIASRLEALTKQLGKTVLLSRAFADFVASVFALERVGEYPVRGFKTRSSCLPITAECRSIAMWRAIPKVRIVAISQFRFRDLDGTTEIHNVPLPSGVGSLVSAGGSAPPFRSFEK
jgi:hypothetical protein